MVPTAIVRRAKALGLNMIAICDHNSAENVAAVTRAGQRRSLSVIPGMEITSREEVHIVGLFKTASEALRMQSLVYENLPGENDETAFGPQTIVDERDQVVGRSARLLIGASELTLEQIVDAIHDFGGLAVAAHIDRQSFGLVGQLGFVPQGLKLDALEVSPRGSAKRWHDLPVITSSDAHLLKDIGKSRTLFHVHGANTDEIGKALRRENGRKAWIPMEDLSLHILDIVENALAASADRIEILIVEDTGRDLLSVQIADNGKGMDAQMRTKALDPFFTTRTTRRVGLGLPLLAQAARDTGGSLELTSEPGRGTRVSAVFQASHPDRKPLGDIAETLRTILAGRPELELQFEHRKDSQVVAEFRSRHAHSEELKHGSFDN